MKRKYVDRKFKDDSLRRIDTANSIIETYQEQGLVLTLRQLYYQFVARHGLENTERSYKGLASLVSDARLAGLIDWDAIEDRGRVPSRAQHFASIGHLVDVALDTYRLDRWEGQRNYVELWVEKQALAGVLEPLAYEFHITLMVNKGYSSQSAMYDSANRFRRNDDKQCVLLYLGDHDPSGEDMVRDIQDRMNMFRAQVEVQKVALTMDQVRQHNPPPNPAKRTDSRFREYADRHGNESWEVDALDPSTLAELIREEMYGLVDLEMMDEVKKREESHKEKLRRVVQRASWE